MVKAKRSLLDAVRFLTKSTVGGRPIAVTFPKSRKALTKEEIMERARQRESGGILDKWDKQGHNLEDEHEGMLIG